MLSKLAVRNAKRSARDYLIYLVTVTFSLSMVYAFNLIVFSSEIRNLSYGMSAMTGTIIFISLIIVFVIGWLICYMTRFILEKRSREFGTYLLLGIPNRDVASLFVRENLLMGAISELTKNKTVIMIAHRLKTVRNADQIFVLSGGHIVQTGKHEDLIRQPGIYADFIGIRKKAIGWKLR